MANLLLNKYQMRTLLDMTGLTPAAWSPLAVLPAVPRGTAPGEPDFDDLVARGFVVADGPYAWRPNRVGTGWLAAACEPEEIIGVKPDHSRIPGFAIVRRGALVCECTVEARTGDTKLVFPISRSAVILRFIQSLTKRDDEPTPAFSADLSRDESFLLAVLARLEVTEVDGLTLNRLYDAARADLDDPVAMSALAAGGILPDLTSASDLGPVLAGLERAGVVHRAGTKVALVEAARLLTEPARAAFTITRVEVHDGVPRRDGLFVSRHGDRTLVLRATNDVDPHVVWTEVTRAQLRALIAAFLLPRDELAAWVAQQDAAPEPAAGVAAAAAFAPFRVRVPARGLPAFAAPDPGGPPVATLAGGIELTVFEKVRDLVHVRADNGWEGWLAGDPLEPVAPTPPQPLPAPAPPPAPAPAPAAMRVRIPPQGLPAFDAPRPERPPIAMLPGGVELIVVAEVGAMAQVRADNGWEGWVARGLLLPA